MKKRIFRVNCFSWSLLFLALNLSAQAQTLFASGDFGYACFRIPALISYSPTHLMAFAEGRKNNCSDFGDVDIVMRSSEDGGRTWSSLKVVADYGTLQAGNPTPILDHLDPKYPEGRLFLCYNTGTASEQETREGKGRRRAYYKTTRDFGKTWSEPVEITQQVHFDRFSSHPEVDARSLAFAPGHGIQLSQGSSPGRLFIPANHSLGNPQPEFAEYRSYGMFSDDHGETWNVTPDVAVPASNEAMAASIHGDSLLMVVRMQDRSYSNKLLVLSTDAGQTWETNWIASDLTTPMCQSSILAVTTPEYKGFYHLGPAATDTRRKLTLWHSTDAGLSWNILQEIWPGSTAYSDLTYLEAGQIGMLYERNDYSEIVFEKATLESTK